MHAIGNSWNNISPAVPCTDRREWTLNNVTASEDHLDFGTTPTFSSTLSLTSTASFTCNSLSTKIWTINHIELQNRYASLSPLDDNDNEQTDMFSLGLVIFECLFQRHPLYAETIPEVQQNILHKEIVLTEEERDSKSEEILNFMF